MLHVQDSDSEEASGADTNMQDMEEGSSESEEEPEPNETLKALIMIGSSSSR